MGLFATSLNRTFRDSGGLVLKTSDDSEDVAHRQHSVPQRCVIK
jgi:hypothetical protein